jgi:hypothetical protein
MKRQLLWLGVVAAVFGAVWLFVFGTAAPCDAMRRTGREVARQEPAETGRVINQAMSEQNQYSSLECIALTLRMKVSGAGAFKIVDVPRR